METHEEEDMFEVMDEIETALKDPRGLAFHQKRLAFLVSLGTVSLLEAYLKKLNVFKPGAKINHLWLKKKTENVKKLISNLITCPIENLKELDNFLDIAFKIEKERNELAYGKRVQEDKLREKIDLFLNLKKRGENA